MGMYLCGLGSVPGLIIRKEVAGDQVVAEAIFHEHFGTNCVTMEGCLGERLATNGVSGLLTAYQVIIQRVLSERIEGGIPVVRPV